MILLDASVAAAVLRDRPPEVRHRLRVALEAGEVVAISSVVLFEPRHGAARSANPARNHARVKAFLARRIDVVPFAQADADEAGELRAELEGRDAPSALTTSWSRGKPAGAGPRSSPTTPAGSGTSRDWRSRTETRGRAGASHSAPVLVLRCSR